MGKSATATKHLMAREAKKILRVRYARRGYEVTRVRDAGEYLVVSFGETEEGIGAGPHGLRSVRCNWPQDEGPDQIDLFPRKSGRRRSRKRRFI